MIEYIRKLPDGRLEWCENGEIRDSSVPLSRVLSRWTQRGLSTVEGRILAVKRQFYLRSRVPLYVEEGLLLMPVKAIRSPDAFLINFHAVREWKMLSTGQAEITFFHGTAVLADSGSIFRKLMAECRRIVDFSHSGGLL